MEIASLLLRVGLALFWLSPILAVSADGWEYEKSGDGVVAYTRAVPGSPFREYKVETEVEATLSQVVAVLVDIPALPEWVERCVEASVLQEISATESISRTVTRSPFPLKDREAIAHGILRQDPKTGVITIESQGRADFLPKDSRYERVHSLRGLWILEPKAEGKRVHIKMIGHTDPGGFIPAAIANHFVVLIPFNTIKNLRRQLKKEKYANAKFDYIRD